MSKSFREFTGEPFPLNAVRVRDADGRHITAVCSQTCAYKVQGAEDSEPCSTLGGRCEVCGTALLEKS